MTKTPSKILVVRFSSLGDVVLTTPVYKNLKAAFPGTRVAVATKEAYAKVLENNPCVDEILALKEGQSLWSFLLQIKSRKFDVLIDLHNNVRSNLLAFFSGVPLKISYRKAALARRLFVQKRIANPELQRHTLDRYLETLKALGIEPLFYPPEIFPEAKTSPARSPLKILIVQTAFLGDAVLTTPMFEAVKNIYPSAHLALLCTPEIRDVFSGNKNIDEILVMDKRGEDRGPGALWRWSRKLAGHYDVALLPHRSFRSALLVWLAGIPKRIGFNNSQGKIFLTDLVRFDWSTHDAERNVKLLEALGILDVKPEVQVPLSGPDPGAFLRAQAVAENALLVGMNPGSVWKTKRWLPERFAEVADRLIEEKNCEILLFGSARDAEAVDAVVRAMKHRPVNLCRKTDLKTLAALIARCSLFITNDSGPMHLACAAKVPVVAVFGPTTRELGFFPYGEKSVVVEMDLACRPCTLHGGEKCPLGHFKCMRDIPAESVLIPARKFLSESAAASRP